MKRDEMKGSEVKVVFIGINVWNMNRYDIKIIYFYYLGK
jgi:hypothetical protein